MTADAGAESRLLGGRYALTEVIGRGGMGVVWLGTDRLLDRPVAVKEITYPVHVTEHEREILRERTLREARNAASLDHPQVTSVFDVVEEDGRPWLVMEHIPSRSLQELVEEQGPLPWHAVARIGLDVLSGLVAAHRAGIVHRDVKPGNVLVDTAGRAYLTDFGIATGTGDSSLTTAGTMIGSPSYMSPERAHGAPIGPPTDMWSLGATLYTAVEGRPAFARDEPMATLMAVVSEHPPPMLHAGPLEPVLRGLLTKDPAQRTTPEQARSQLQAVLTGQAAASVWPPPVPQSAGPPPPPPPHAAAAARGDRIERISAEDLKALAVGSAAALGSVARDQARHLAEKRRERRADRARSPAPSGPPAPAPVRRGRGGRPRRRFKRRWIVVPTVVVALVALAVVAGLVALVVTLA
ncbi:serine/threonine-protein kinase [Trujillonella endophytica]|uniref:non-specific serine/threonine protein kinase n=1 Tax=Trujillonella endophytica TaxID=673521 RepID=A0A1H8W872_9ACTN|nr:serine/threonine-protein kinase [Trujillella endophytica]SEP23865.1 Serine/threonine protein kinase [Trujillella endophytica]